MIYSICRLWLQFFVFLLIILVAEVTVVVLAIQNREGLTAAVKDSLKTIVQKEYTGNQFEARTNIVDEIQRQVRSTVQATILPDRSHRTSSCLKLRTGR